MKECKNCSKELEDSNFWPNRKICKKCYHNKYQRKTCKDCGFVYSHSAGSCKVCKYKNGKVCNCCGKKLPIEEFYKGTNSKYRTNCKSCEVIKSGEYRRNNPGKVSQSKKKWSDKNPESVKKTQIRVFLKQRVEVDNLEELVERIFNCNNCECCGGVFLNPRDKHMDHCHETNNFRGVICRSCNHTLGHAKDSIEKLENCIKYLIGTI